MNSLSDQEVIEALYDASRTGTRIDLASLFENPTALLAVPGFLLLMLVVRAIPTSSACPASTASPSTCGAG